MQLGGGQPEVFFGGAPFVQSAHVSLLHAGGSGLAESQVQSVVHAALPADGDGQTPLAGQAGPNGPKEANYGVLGALPNRGPPWAKL